MYHFRQNKKGFTPLERKIYKTTLGIRRNKLKYSLTGFTLIELLVSIGIISVLSGILYASFSEARAQARDDTRMAQLKELQLAIERYKNQTGKYPEQCDSGRSWSGEQSSGDFACNDGSAEYIIGLVPDFIDKLPTDPKANSGSNDGFIYRTNNTRTMYKAMTNHTVEAKTVKSYENEFARCPFAVGRGWCDGSGPISDTYAVYSLGAEAW